MVSTLPGAVARKTDDGYRNRAHLRIRIAIRVALVTTKYEHVALVERPAFARYDQVDPAPLAAQVFARTFGMWDSDHAGAGLDFHAEKFEFVQYFSSDPAKRNDYDIADPA